MENSRFRTRPAVFLGAALMSVFALVGCGTGPVGRSAAATVNGHDISFAKVTSLLDAQRRYLESQAGKPGIDPDALAEALASTDGTGRGTYAMGEASSALQEWINYRITVAHIEANGESITDADREAARADLIAQLGGDEAALDDVDEELLNFSIDSGAATRAISRVVPSLSDDERAARLQELFDEVAPERPLCLSIIVSETEADSLVALERVEAGDDFATVATELSADAQTAEGGGFSGCASVERAAEFFGGDYSTVAVGETVGPVQKEVDSGGVLFLLVHINSTTGPTFEQLAPELEQQLDAELSNSESEYLNQLRLDADVTVDPRFGTWDAETGTLTPPAA